MKRSILVCLIPVLFLSGCSEAPPGNGEVTQLKAVGETPNAPKIIKDAQGETVLVLMNGLRSYDDPCKVIGESAATADYLDHTTLLVACPLGDKGIEDVSNQMKGTQLTTLEGYQLLSVPR